MPNSGKECSFIAGGNVKWYSYLEGMLAVSYEAKHHLIII
jgi:hypothetical protein